MRDVLHRVNLGLIGGVERLFCSYMSRATKTGFNQHVLVGGKIAPLLQSIIHKEAASVAYLKYWKGIKLPRCLPFLRRWHHQNLFQQHAGQLLMLWNAFGERQIIQQARQQKCSVIFYDHGSAISQPDAPMNGAFLDDVDLILACSRSSKRTMELRWGAHRPITIVRNPLHYRAVPRSEPRDLPHNRPYRLGVAARLVPIKGVSLAIHALSLLRETKLLAELHIAGTGPEHSKLKSLVKHLNLSGHVFFHGLVPDMRRYYEEIDLLLIPSLREPFGLVGLEAAAHGCPIVCSRIDGLPEAVIHGAMGLCLPPSIPLKEYPRLGGTLSSIPRQVFDPVKDQLVEPSLLDPAVLADNIRNILQSPSLYQQLSKGCLSTTAKDYSFTDYISQLESAMATTFTPS